MKLRTQLFLSSSALLTVALVGLLVGLFGVLSLTQSQTYSVGSNIGILKASLGMRQEIGRQVTLLLSEQLDREALSTSDERFKEWLAKAGEQARTDEDRQAVAEIGRAYAVYDDVLYRPRTLRRDLLSDDTFSLSVAAMRDRINEVQYRYLAYVEAAESTAHQRAWLIAGLLGLIGLAVLLLGLLTAHSIAQRFGRPIEALAKAADKIGQGDFNVTLPLSPVNEISALSRRFGVMAEALREFKNSDLEALQSEQRRLQAVLDSIDDGLLILDQQGDVDHFNPVARRQLDWDSRELGQTLGQAMGHPELDEQVREVLAGNAFGSEQEDLAVEVAGETRLLDYSLTPVVRTDSWVQGAVMVLRDVTEQRAFERVRREFVLRSSHELRTPVTGMHMAFSLLQERLQFAEGSRERDLLETVDEEMRRLVDLINDLLNFSRYQNGLQKLELAPCDPVELASAAVARFQAQADERGISLQLDVSEDAPRARLDRLQIERVLDNLIGNALRHCQQGGQVAVRLRRQGERVWFSVEDNGEGIAYSQQVRVFEPFVQVGSKKGGAGLGLALCKEVVQLHGGNIGVQSRPGAGAQFYFTLPL
ncbi:MAG: PAS domain-containing sensor histidine kinase [Pseudomonadales bacterium]|jgi:two-component system, NtrC family, sensor histidine kinase KinB|nr:PAS domain-containing sensor histidine kinase [Pseudomonadales bacterium]MBP75962.1 PAS domain-containing sensor histidine kinase [Pseudomonadales bacterium]MCK5529949.1 HAMP domain-containing protein [Halopseudomonas aestusnigri]|tara:strand:- start:7862 stop:9637 length:1776 start_codon:yes stop_codon:yes gene_type:complete